MNPKNIAISAVVGVAMIGGVIWFAMQPAPQYGHRTMQRTPECEEMSAIMLGRCTGQAKGINSKHCISMREHYAKICRN